ncbi:hypothetical protein T02_7377, partial [Trichinella nativa]
LLFYANNKLHLNCTLEIPFTSETITILSEKTGFREKNKFHKRHISLVLLFCSLAYMINGPDAALNKQLPENQMNFRKNEFDIFFENNLRKKNITVMPCVFQVCGSKKTVREYLRNDDDMMQWSENKSDQLIDNSPSLDSRLRERAVEIGSRLKLVADQMDKDRRGTIKTVVEQYLAADWLETRDAVSGQQWSTVSLVKRDKKSSDWPGSENKCRPLSPAPPHRPD